jgi:hypothetical protein
MAYIGTSPSQGVRHRYLFTATSGQTTFSGADDDSRTLSYTDTKFMDVFLNGVLLDPNSDYTATTGTSVVLTSGASAGDLLEVIAFDSFSVFSGTFGGDVTVGGTLGVGTSTPDANLHIEGSGVSSLRFGNIGPLSNSSIRVSRDDTSVTAGNPLGFLEFGGNDSTSNIDAAFAYISGEASGVHEAGSNQTDLTFGTTSSGSSTPQERIRILSTGGITFNGDTSTANALDDYEEGTWTPQIQFSDTSATTTVTRARYIKIGAMVHVSATITTASTSSGIFEIAGLPFSPNANVETTGSVMSNNVNYDTGTMNVVTYHYNAGGKLNMYASKDSGTWYPLSNSHVTSGDQFIFSHTYYIS